MVAGWRWMSIFRRTSLHIGDRSDAAPLVPGRREEIVIVLLPIARRFAKGSRIRVAIAGADIDNYGQVPHGSPPRLHHWSG
jgi:predicted acyl esterase